MIAPAPRLGRASFTRTDRASADPRPSARLEPTGRLRLLVYHTVAENSDGPAFWADEPRLDPLDGETLILLGQHYAATNVEKAVFYFERAEGVEKTEADARLRHAQVLVRNGKYQEALPLLKRALELKPREDVQRYAEQVERAARRNG